ncbi:hypothetical protein HD554DRAFT_2038256 [Boletus coccyginus]|nr:hypothetical protein HD554DRAFT_2038256 [Boletus coccyginus]
MEIIAKINRRSRIQVVNGGRFKSIDEGLFTRHYWPGPGPDGSCYHILPQLMLHHAERFHLKWEIFKEGMLDGLSDLQGRVHDIAAIPSLDGDEEDEPQAIEGNKSIYDIQLARKPVPNIPRIGKHVAACYGTPELAEYIWCFLYDQQNPDVKVPGDRVDLQDCPSLNGDVKGGAAQYDCVLVNGGGLEDDPLSSRMLFLFMCPD